MGEGKRDGGTGKKTLTLLSPVGGPPLTYTWPLQQLVRVSLIHDNVIFNTFKLLIFAKF